MDNTGVCGDGESASVSMTIRVAEEDDPCLGGRRRSVTQLNNYLVNKFNFNSFDTSSKGNRYDISCSKVS